MNLTIHLEDDDGRQLSDINAITLTTPDGTTRTFSPRTGPESEVQRLLSAIEKFVANGREPAPILTIANRFGLINDLGTNPIPTLHKLAESVLLLSIIPNDVSSLADVLDEWQDTVPDALRSIRQEGKENGWTGMSLNDAFTAQREAAFIKESLRFFANELSMNPLVPEESHH